jgi:Domain of unknown function (DUF4956)
MMALQQLIASLSFGQFPTQPDSALAILDAYAQNPGAQVPLLLLLANLGIGLILALILRWHFSRFSSTLANRDQFANVFPFVLLTTLLIITIVKSSLALSLGLVGALSIVRFRTPIKEPEELAYLFIAIAIGLGLGANQTLPTIVASLAILTAIGVLKTRKGSSDERNLYLSVDWEDGRHPPEERLDQLNASIREHSRWSNMRRFDIRGGTLEATYIVGFDNAEQFSQLVASLQKEHEGIGLSFLDQSHLPTV